MTQIVCGAPNARAGITAVLAKPGMYIPGLDITISVGKIRGVESHGMMASERELELSDEHNGIIELEERRDWHGVRRLAGTHISRPKSIRSSKSPSPRTVPTHWASTASPVIWPRGGWAR